MLLVSVWVPHDSDHHFLDDRATALPIYSRLKIDRKDTFVFVTPRGWLSVVEFYPAHFDLSRIARALQEIAFHLAGAAPSMREPLRDAEILRDRPERYARLFWQTSFGILIAFGAAMVLLVTYARR